MMKKSAELTDDLLMVTRMIKDNTEKSTRTLDKLGKLLIYISASVNLVKD